MKRLLLLLAVVAMLVGCTSSPKCEIVGRLDNCDTYGTVYLYDKWNTNQLIDSVSLQGNSFHFEKIVHEPTLAQLVTDKGRLGGYLFIEEGKVLVSGDYFLGTMNPSGTPANDAFSAMSERSAEIEARRRKAVGAGDKEQVEAAKNELEEMIEEFASQNVGNVFGLYMLHQQSFTLPSKALLDKFVLLPEPLQTLPFAQRMKAMAERRFKTEPQMEGSDYVPHYIDIEQPNLKGEVVSLKSVVENKQNRYVLLNFWASWWRPSLDDMAVLKEAYSLYHAKGFEIYGTSLDRRKESWGEAIDEHNIEWITVSSLEEFNSKAVEDYVVDPTLLPNFLIDCSNGVIIAKNLRGKALLDKLAELYK